MPLGIPNTIRFLIIISNIKKDRSFVDDLNTEHGIVSMRVGLSYDLLRLSLCSLDLSYWTFLSLFGSITAGVVRIETKSQVHTRGRFNVVS